MPDSKQNPLMDEFFKRVEYANQQFSHIKMPGWKKDRGRVYIIYGDIDKSNSSYDSGEYEIWYYNDLQKKFVFYDEHGFGDYCLISGND